ncbi:DHHW family protein [Paenibacillus thermotolerans]|uniref:DHHW family protein n=1 Tax=Paenibacillus thermotolerans TaxID=3027807 RepID=UPI0023675662|nr:MULTISPECIES: DHHW family protein [unclassified Paenibacillus]
MRIGNMLQILFFAGFLVTGTALTLFAHVTSSDSETENRRLASFPVFSVRNVLSGGFFRELENYTADHIAFRDSFIRTSKWIASFQGKSGTESALIVPSAANNSAEAQAAPSAEESAGAGQPGQSAGAAAEASAKSAESAPRAKTRQAVSPLSSASAEEEGKRQGRVLIIGDRAMNLYSFDAASGQAYADAVNRIHERLEQAFPNGIRTSVLIAPTAAEFIRSPKLKSLSDSQRKAIDEIYGKLKPEIAKVDALSPMLLHAGEPLFFRTDHHWTAVGAYYAYSAFIEANGMNPVPVTAYEKGEVPQFLGSLYASTMNRRLAARPDTIVYFKPYVKHRYTVHYTGSLDMPLIDMRHAKKKNKYRIFLSGDRPWGHIAAEADSKRRLLVIKDSYGNALVPFLLPHYSDIFVVDPRQFDQPLIPFIREHRIEEIVYVNNIGVTSGPGFAGLLRKLVAE